ncbi:MAG: hypothetical protein Q8M15_07690 [Bacteroidota bacterium]|nr:hypothetical protein [Bacteroidota bacterium]
MKQAITTLYLSVLTVGLIYAQNSVNPVSPNAAAFGKYIDIPVGEATGIPPIQIPIDEIDDPGLKLAISLSYHAGGQRVNDIATSVGLGWSLNAGGQITRVVNGKPDDFTEGYWTQYERIPNRPVNYMTDFSLLNSISNGAYDTEPDLFYYNFNGESGKFILSNILWGLTPARHGETIPKSKLKIEYLAGKFTITTLGGIVYEFGITEAVSQAVTSNGNSDPVTFTSNWLLSKISSPLCENNILFDYDEEVNLVYSSILSQSLKNYLAQEGSSTSPNFCINNSGLNNAWSFSGLSQRRLNRITFSTGYYLFVKGAVRTDLAGDYTLEFIKKYNTNDELISEYKFQYIYKGNRLHLSKIFEGKGGIYLPPTEFFYNTMNLPTINSFSQDYWGFYNNKANTNLIPDNIINKPYFDFANREPNEAGTKASNLEQIIYSTGGSTIYEYEQNKYSFNSGNLPINNSIGTPVILNANVTALGGGGLTNQTYTINILFPQKIRVEFISTFPVNAPAYQQVSKSFNMMLGTQSLIYTQVNANTREYNILTAGTYQITIGASSEFSDFTYHGMISYQSGLIIQKFKYGPGLRIKKITKNDAAGNIFGKSYSYTLANEPDRQSGMMPGNLEYLQNFKEYTNISPAIGCPIPCYVLCTFQVVSSETKIGPGKVNGSYIVYKEVVTEDINPNFTTVSNGYVRKFFAAPNNSGITGFPAVTSLFPDYLYGYVTKEQIFDNANLKKKEVIYNYSSDNYFSTVFLHGLKVARIIFGYLPSDPSSSIIPHPFFQFKQYLLTNPWFKLDSKFEYTYSNNAFHEYLVESTEYFYENPIHLLLTKKITTIPDGTVLMEETRYPPDMNLEYFNNSHTNPEVRAMRALVASYIFNTPIEIYSSKKFGNTFKVIKSTLNKYSFVDSRPLLTSQYSLKIANPVSNFQLSYVTDNGLNYHPDYYETIKFNSYSKYGIANEISERGKVKSTIHSSLAPYVIAAAENASNSDMGYCGFEDYECRNSGTSTNFLSGNLSLIRNSASCNYIESTDFVTGSKGFVLGGTCASSIQSALPLNADQTYKIQFWMKNGSTLSVYNGYTAQTNPQTIKIANGWTLQEYTLTNCISFSISGSGIIDDIKYFPVGALMKTWVYKPLIGILSEENENNNHIYYEYDGFNRLDKILNEDKKIIKKYIYSLGEVQ